MSKTQAFREVLNRHQSPENVRTATIAALVVLHLLALGTVVLADVKGFWVDERIAFDHITTLTPWELLVSGATWPPHYPTWFVITDLVGIETMLWISRLGHVALIYPTYRLGQWYADSEVGLQAAFFVAVSPFLAAQAGWLRMYGMLNAALIWGLWFGISGQLRRSAACCAVAAILHPFGAFGGIWLGLHASRRLPTRKLLAVVGAGLVPLTLTMAWVVAHQGFSIGATGVIHGIKPDALRFVLTPATALVGSPHSRIQVGLVLLGTLFLGMGRHNRELLLWIFTPLVSLTLVSYAVQPIFRVKYFGFVAPAVAVMLAGLSRERYIRFAAGACFGAAMLYSWFQRLSIPAIVARRFIFWFA